jgi:HAD superfamily hydrolase (TIGR01549 family)
MTKLVMSRFLMHDLNLEHPKFPNQKRKKLLIFDFDGTIVDSKTAYYNSIIKQLNPMGFSKKRITEAINLGLSLWDTLGEFIPSALRRWWIRRKIMKDVLKEASTIRKCHDSEHIKDIHIKKILISNSLSEFVIPVLKHFKMIKVFDKIYCADDFDNKTKFIINYLKTKKINPRECFYVGDRVADVALAKKIGCKSIIVYGKCSWNSKKEIMKAKPDFVVPDLILVKKIVEKS